MRHEDSPMRSDVIALAHEIDQLDAYQRALTEALVELDGGAAIKARLLADPRCAPFRDEIAAFDEHAIEATAAMSKSWVLRSDAAW